MSKTRWTSSCAHDDLDPADRRFDAADEREQRADLGVRLAADVLAGARAEGVVERVLVGVDEEVDRFVLGHAEQLRRLLDGLLADPQGALAERGAALVPVDA